MLSSNVSQIIIALLLFRHCYNYLPVLADGQGSGDPKTGMSTRCCFRDTITMSTYDKSL